MTHPSRPLISPIANNNADDAKQNQTPKALPFKLESNPLRRQRANRNSVWAMQNTLPEQPKWMTQ